MVGRSTSKHGRPKFSNKRGWDGDKKEKMKEKLGNLSLLIVLFKAIQRNCKPQ